MTAATDAAPVATKTITEEEVAKVAISHCIDYLVRNSHLKANEPRLWCPLHSVEFSCQSYSPIFRMKLFLICFVTSESLPWWLHMKQFTKLTFLFLKFTLSLIPAQYRQWLLACDRKWLEWYGDRMTNLKWKLIYESRKGIILHNTWLFQSFVSVWCRNLYIESIPYNHKTMNNERRLYGVWRD